MPLDHDKTTTVTEAIEAGTDALVDVLENVGQRAEEVVSYWTRPHHQPDAGIHLANVFSLQLEILKGSVYLLGVAADNAALIGSKIPIHWRSDPLDLSAFRPAAGTHLLSIVEVRNRFGQVIGPPSPPLGAYGQPNLAQAAGSPNDPRIDRLSVVVAGAVPPNQVGPQWDGFAEIALRQRPFVPGSYTFTVRASDMNGSVVHEAPVVAELMLDQGLFSP